MRKHQIPVLDTVEGLKELTTEEMMGVDGGRSSSKRSKSSPKKKNDGGKASAKQVSTNPVKVKKSASVAEPASPSEPTPAPTEAPSTTSGSKKKKRSSNKRELPLHVLPGGRHIVGDDVTYDARSGVFRRMDGGSIADDVTVRIVRSEGHTNGHYRSKLQVTAGGAVLYENDAHSWADHPLQTPGQDFTLPAGDYVGQLEMASNHFKMPIRLENPAAGVTGDLGFLIHANEMSNGHTWRNTGSSRGCVVLQGQMASQCRLVNVLESTGFSARTRRRRNSRRSVPVEISDPRGIHTTRFGIEWGYRRTRIASTPR